MSKRTRGTNENRSAGENACFERKQMKRRLLILGIAIIFILTLLPATAMAEYTVPDGYNSHDYNAMVNFLKQPSAVEGQTNAQALGYDITNPGTWTEVVWSSDAEKRIVQIEYCFDNSSGCLAGSLDLSNCTALETLGFIKTEVTALNVSGCTALTDLDCDENCLTGLDLSGCEALQSLQCNKNMIVTLDVSGCPKLLSLACGENELTSLDVSKNTALQELYCRVNQLTSLDVKANTALRSLDCGINQLTSLDVSGCAALEELYCDDSVTVTRYSSFPTPESSVLPSLTPESSALPSPLSGSPTFIYLLFGLGLLVIAVAAAWILIRRRRKKRNQ